MKFFIETLTNVHTKNFESSNYDLVNLQSILTIFFRSKNHKSSSKYFITIFLNIFSPRFITTCYFYLRCKIQFISIEKVFGKCTYAM